MAGLKIFYFKKYTKKYPYLCIYCEYFLEIDDIFVILHKRMLLILGKIFDILLIEVNVGQVMPEMILTGAFYG